jgi:hypothetical protein
MDRDVAVMGLALAFADLTAQERQLLAELRDLFRSGKEGRGTGDLNPLMPRGGYIALSDDMFPRYGKKKDLKDSEPVGRLKGYWRTEEIASLVELARILPLDDFLKLQSDEDMSRLLEALWRGVRAEFDTSGLESIIQVFDKDIIPVLEDCHGLERKGISDFGLAGLDFGTTESLVKAKGGFERLRDIGKSVLGDEGSGSILSRYILKTFMSSLNVQSEARNIGSATNSVKRAMEELATAGGNLEKNFWEYPRATKFIGITEDDVKALISEKKKMEGTLTLQELESKSRESKSYLEEVSSGLARLDENLVRLETIFNKVSGSG